MTELTGKHSLSVSVTAGETYAVRYDDYVRTDIYNGTDGDIYVNATGEFTLEDGVGEYLTIPSGCGYNSYPPIPPGQGGILYIYAAAAGVVSVKTVKAVL